MYQELVKLVDKSGVSGIEAVIFIIQPQASEIFQWALRSNVLLISLL